jgi:hypothetical protein
MGEISDYHGFWSHDMGTAAALICLLAFAVVITWQILSGSAADSFSVSPEIMALLVILFSLFLYFIKPGIRTVCILTAVAGLIMIFLNGSFFTIDERNHFAYSQFIIMNGRVPKFNDVFPVSEMNQVFPGGSADEKFIEAIQTPLYYAVLSLLTFFIKSIKIRLYVCRIYDLVLGLLTLLTIYKTLLFLKAEKVISLTKDNLGLISLLAFAPLFLTTSSVVTNDAQMVFLSAMAFFFLAHVICRGSGLLPLTAVIVLLVWTKISTVCFIAVLFAVLFIKKRFQEMFLSAGCAAVSLIPWFVYNMMTYGDLTGGAEHIALVKDVLNPDGAAVTFMQCIGFIPSCGETFFSTDLIKFSGTGAMFLASAVSTAVILASFLSLIYLVVECNRRKSVFRLDTGEMMLAACMLAVFMEYTTMTVMSVRTNLFIITPRGMMTCILPFLYSSYFWLSRIKSGIPSWLSRMLIAFTSAFFYLEDLAAFFSANMAVK